MQYNNEHGWWFPDGEQHLPQWMSATTNKKQLHGRSLYQHTKYDAVRQLVPCLQPGILTTNRKKTAIDVGSHIGLWTWMMLQDFDHIHCFEPHPEHRDCWYKNIFDAVEPWKVDIYPFALGETVDNVTIRTRTHGSSGDTGVEPNSNPDTVGIRVQQYPLDRFRLAIGKVDLIKIDCEGYELWVCKGGSEMILENKPIIIIEQKPGTGMEQRYGIGATDGVKYLESLGMRVIREISGDYIMGW